MPYLLALAAAMAVRAGGSCTLTDNATKACVRAARNAIEFNSIPSIGTLVPGGYPRMKLAVELAVPLAHHGSVDLDAVAEVFPYGSATLRLQEGGAPVPALCERIKLR